LSLGDRKPGISCNLNHPQSSDSFQAIAALSGLSRGPRQQASLFVVRVNAAIFQALRPGGVFLVIDHVATAGSGLRDTETLHRIDPDTIRSEVTTAGFVFESQSEALRNPADSHSLPVFDPAIRHKTDQVILKFRKPTPSVATREPEKGAD
jgi:predicted methyltransferase